MTKKIYVYWWGHGNDTFSNFGDALNPVLIENLSGMNVAKAACSKISTLLMMKKVFGLVAKRNSWDELKLTFYGWTARKIIFAVGSVIQWNGHKKSIIWGSGLLYRDAYPQKCQVRAVRGPFTRERLLELGFDVPPVYGDPALLLPLIYSTQEAKKYDLTLTPHYTHFQSASEMFGHLPVHIVDVLKSTLEVLHHIVVSKRILSSSLHGIIVAHAYGIPALWVKTSDASYSGDNIKFKDYFASVGIDYYDPVELNETMLHNYEELFESHKPLTLPTVDLSVIRKNLIACAPFPVLPGIKAKL